MVLLLYVMLQILKLGMSNKNFLRNTAYENINDIQNAIQEKLGKLEEYTLTQGMNIDLGGDEEID